MLIPMTSVAAPDDNPLRDRPADNRERRQNPVSSAGQDAPVAASPPIERPEPQDRIQIAPWLVLILLAGFFMSISLTLILTGPRVEGGDQSHGRWDGAFITARNRDAAQ